MKFLRLHRIPTDNTFTEVESIQFNLLKFLREYASACFQ